jgi:hypothetical protein
VAIADHGRDGGADCASARCDVHRIILSIFRQCGAIHREFIENSSALGKNGAYDDRATSDRILRVLTRDEGTGFPPEEQLAAYSRVKETTRR